MIELTLTPEEAAQILLRTHAIEALSLQSLGSELASTFSVQTAAGRIAVKFQGSDDTERPVQLWRVAVSDELARRGHPVPAAIRGMAGALIEGASHRGSQVQVLAMDWVDAAPYGSITVPDGFGFTLGASAGRLQRDLRDMPRPPHEISHTWDSRVSAEVIAAHLAQTDDAGIALVGESALALHAEFIAPIEPRLPLALVHQDLHDSNVLATASGEIAAIIDFDDMLVGWRVAEPAVAAAYLARGSADPVRTLLSVAAGWESEVSFTEEERQAFGAIAAVRLALNSVVWHARMQSDRGAYAGVRSNGSLPAFHALSDWLRS